MKNNLKLIINSDDFGLSESVNIAITRSFEEGYISSTSMMANMPGFDTAINLAITNPNLKGRIGLHLNLTEGVPLTDPIKKQPLFCNKDGRFIYDRKKPIFQLGYQEKKAIYLEIKAQLNRLIDQNITPTHLDSHHHVHTEFGIIGVYLKVAKEYAIQKIRLTKNIGTRKISVQIYKLLYNTYIQKVGKMRTTQIFCSASEFRALMTENLVREKLAYEIMVHAKLNENGELIDIDNQLMSAKVKPILNLAPLISYHDL